jgi:hypothetical protein
MPAHCAAGVQAVLKVVIDMQHTCDEEQDVESTHPALIPPRHAVGLLEETHVWAVWPPPMRAQQAWLPTVQVDAPQGTPALPAVPPGPEPPPADPNVPPRPDAPPCAARAPPRPLSLPSRATPSSRLVRPQP